MAKKRRGNPNMRKGKPSVNPKGRGGNRLDSDKAVMRADGWYSMITGIGTNAYDKRLGADFCADTVSYALAVDLMRGDDIAHRAVRIPIEDALRNGFDFTAVADDDDLDTKELQEEIEAGWETLDLMGVIAEAMCYEGSFGGASVLLGVDDGQKDLSIPMNLRSVRGLEFLNIFEPRECIPAYYYADPRKPNYGRPSHYQLSPYSPGRDIDGGGDTETIFVHESRLLIFPGIKVTRDILNENAGWGDSKLTMMAGVLRDFNMSWAGTGVLINGYGMGTYKMDGLGELLSEQGGEKLVQEKLKAMELARSVVKATLIDAKDEYVQHAVNVTGLSELLKSFMSRMSSAAGGMPITKLFGVAPAGLNSSGDSDIDQWDDRVRSIQQAKVVPHIKRVTEVLLHVKKSKTKSWVITPRALRQQTDQEKAETRNKQADTDTKYIQAGVVSPEEIALSRFGGDAYSLETVIDFNNRIDLDPVLTPEETLNPEQAAAQGETPDAKPEPKGKDGAKNGKQE